MLCQDKQKRDPRRMRGGLPLHDAPVPIPYGIELATLEKTLFALEPISRMVPTTITRITASITAYSAISCPSSSRHNLQRRSIVSGLLRNIKVLKQAFKADKERRPWRLTSHELALLCREI